MVQYQYMSILTEQIEKAITNRAHLITQLEAEATDTYRLFHGVNEGRRGLAVDRYGSQVMIQTFQDPLSAEEMEEVKSVLSDQLRFEHHFVYNDRSDKIVKNLFEDPQSREPLTCKELGVTYRIVGIHRGQDPLLYLDLRSARRYIMSHSAGKSILNLFAYTCGVGIAAATAGATEIWNVDFSRTNLSYGEENAKLNNTPAEKIRFISQDFFPVVRQLACLGIKGKARRRKFMRFDCKLFDIVFLDPPTWAVSPFGKVDIINDYQGLFKPALLSTKRGGKIICTNHAASVDVDLWCRDLMRCAEKAEWPIKEITLLEPEADFPSPDGRFPLKIAVCQL